MNLVTILILAFTVEALVEYGKLIFVERTINWKQIVAIVFSVGLALAARVDLFPQVGVTFYVPYLGTILTGILFSRGANYFADFIKLTQSATRMMNTVPDIIEDNIAFEERPNVGD